MNQEQFNSDIGALDHLISKLVIASKRAELGEANRQTLKHHAEDMVEAGKAIGRNVKATQEKKSEPVQRPFTPQLPPVSPLNQAFMYAVPKPADLSWWSNFAAVPLNVSTLYRHPNCRCVVGGNPYRTESSKSDGNHAFVPLPCDDKDNPWRFATNHTPPQVVKPKAEPAPCPKSESRPAYRAPAPEPGYGYRLVDTKHDHPKTGDEIWLGFYRKWADRKDGNREFFPTLFYRRRNFFPIFYETVKTMAPEVESISFVASKVVGEIHGTTVMGQGKAILRGGAEIVVWISSEEFIQTVRANPNIAWSAPAPV